MIDALIKGLLGLAPVIFYLFTLRALDSYKLVAMRSVMLAVVCGCAGLVACYFLHGWLINELAIDRQLLSRYISPLSEEITKALLLVWMIRRRRVGFMVDAAILGFAVGAGFGILENIFYMSVLPDAELFTWILRGCGTAVMHGSTTATFAVISQSICERRGSALPVYFLPGLAVAAGLHSLFNHFFISPALFAIGQVVVLPLVMIVMCRLSEQALTHWLDFGFDTDAELLAIINSGRVSENPIGEYLISLNNHFPPAIVADMYCLLALQVELSVQAKGLLMMRREGFDIPPVPQVREKLTELTYLEQNIGRTGRLALRPFLRQQQRDSWEKHLLKHG